VDLKRSLVLPPFQWRRSIRLIWQNEVFSQTYWSIGTCSCALAPTGKGLLESFLSVFERVATQIDAITHCPLLKLRECSGNTSTHWKTRKNTLLKHDSLLLPPKTFLFFYSSFFLLARAKKIFPFHFSKTPTHRSHLNACKVLLYR